MLIRPVVSNFNPDILRHIVRNIQIPFEQNSVIRVISQCMNEIQFKFGVWVNNCGLAKSSFTMVGKGMFETVLRRTPEGR